MSLDEARAAALAALLNEEVCELRHECRPRPAAHLRPAGQQLAGHRMSAFRNRLTEAGWGDLGADEAISFHLFEGRADGVEPLRARNNGRPAVGPWPTGHVHLMAEVTAHHGLFRSTHLHIDDTGGAGRPVVLIHGWPLSGESWSGQVPALVQAGHRVVTYDRRGFGRSDKPKTGYDYDTLAEDLHTLLTELDLDDVTVVGFSMGGGEVARFSTKYGAERLRSVVLAAAVTPYMAKTSDNPDGPLEEDQAAAMTAALTADEETFYDDFTTGFFSVDGVLKVTEAQRQDALALCRQADKNAALQAMASFANTDFRDDLPNISVPVLVLHGDGDATVPYEGSGARTHAALPGSELRVIAGAPHGCNVSHPEEFNRALLDFLAK